MTDRELRDKYALEIAEHLGWRQLKDAPFLWSDGEHNPKCKTEVINIHRDIAFLREQVIKRNLQRETAFFMLSDCASAITQVLKIILDDIKKHSDEEESV
jgi:hypothetical protein